MEYYFYWSFPILLLILVTVLYLTRSTWFPHLPYALQDFSIHDLSPGYLYSRLGSSLSSADEDTDFFDDAASGLTSNSFNLATNIEAGDSRQGLDGAGKREVQRIMKRDKVGFDEARRIVMQKKFRRAGIGEDGLPRDPKFVSFS